MVGIRGTKMNETCRRLGCISNCQTFFRLGISFKRTKAQYEKQFKGELLQTERFSCGRVGKGKPKGAFAPVQCLRELYGSPEHV